MDDHTTPPSPYPGPPQDPDYLRRARNIRAAYDLLFPMVVGATVLVLLVLLVAVPSLRDPSILGVIGTALVAIAGLGIRRR